MLKIYYSDISEFSIDLQNVNVLSDVRQDYLNSITDSFRKKQSLLVWKLLEIAFQINKIDLPQFYVINDKWFAKDENVFFSISHSRDIVTVAISDNPVGIDVEAISNKAVKVCKRLNLSSLGDLCDSFNEIQHCTKSWVEYESQFKRGGVKWHKN